MLQLDIVRPDSLSLIEAGMNCRDDRSDQVRAIAW